MLTTTAQEIEAPWESKLADQLRRGSLTEVKTELRKGLHHVVGCYLNTQGETVCFSHAYFSKQHLAEDAVRRIRRMSILN